MEKFHEESVAAGKSQGAIPSSLATSVSVSTNFVILSLVNETQCEDVCFAGDENLVGLLSKGACVIVTSTVTGRVELKRDSIHY